MISHIADKGELYCRLPHTSQGGIVMEKKNAIVSNNVVEKELRPLPGMLMLFVLIIGFLASIALCVFGAAVLYGGALGAALTVGIIGCIVFPILAAGLKVVNPNEALVLTLFGKYYGTIKKAGFHFVNPFSTGFKPTAKSALEEIAGELTESKKKGAAKKAPAVSKKVSTKTMTLNNAQQKVNDVQGNPIIIGSVVIWKVADPTKAVFNV